MKVLQVKPYWAIFFALAVFALIFIASAYFRAQDERIESPERMPVRTRSKTVSSDAGAPLRGKPLAQWLIEASDARVGRTGNRRPDTPALAERYARSTSLRSFVYAAAEMVDSGGLLAISASVEDCFGPSLGKSGLPVDLIKVESRSAQARAELMARCDIDEGERHQLMEALFSRRMAAMAADPLMAASLEMARSARSHSQALNYVHRMIDSGLPVAGYSALTMGNEAGSSEYYFNGTYFNTEEKQRLLLDAWQLTRCDAGEPCGLGSLAWLRVCAERGWCEGTVESSLRQGYVPSPDLAKAFEQLQIELRAAFKNKDYAKFVPVAGAVAPPGG